MKTVYHIARTQQELEEAFSLVYKEYLQRGYIPKKYKSKLRISIYNALPGTATFVAKQKGNVVAGVTLIRDSELGVPMDKIYKDKMDSLRKKGRRIAEVSQLSIDSRLFGKSFFSMFNFNKLIFVFRLFKLMLDYAVEVNKITDFCIAINPKQQCLYKFLGFEQIGGLKYYGSVNRAPAIALRLNLIGLEEKAKTRKGLYKIFFSKRTDPKLFSKKFKLTKDALNYFFVKKSDIFKKASKKHLDIIKKHYPN
jgi:hypothetical protein